MNWMICVGAALAGATVATLAVVGWSHPTASERVPPAAAGASRVPNASPAPGAADVSAEPRGETGASLAHIERGLALEAEGKLEEAVAEYRKAIEADSARAMARLSLLAGLENPDHLDAAAAQFHDALTINADTARRHHDVALALSEGRLDRAAGLYREATDASPAYAQALQVLWAALESRGIFSRMVSVLDARVASDPSSLNAHRTLAAVYWTKGNYAEGWREVHLCQQAGGTLDPAFLNALREKLPEPDQWTPGPAPNPSPPHPVAPDTPPRLLG
jgi:tetratricopeptide (TPR) repeat protein